MLEVKHTPGPWQVTRDKLGVCVATNNFLSDYRAEKDDNGSDDWSIADCKPGPLARDNDEECEANARLIAAAPEQHQALMKAERFISGFEDDELQEGINGLLTEIRAALFKAEGRS